MLDPAASEFFENGSYVVVVWRWFYLISVLAQWKALPAVLFGEGPRDT
jgi:hypothetical protein